MKFNFFFTASLSVYSERLDSFHDKRSLKLSLSSGVSIWMDNLKIYDLLLDQKLYLTLKKAN